MRDETRHRSVSSRLTDNMRAETSTNANYSRFSDSSGFHTRYCDERLGLLDIGYWTKVPISTELAATLTPFNLRTDHTILGFPKMTSFWMISSAAATIPVLLFCSALRPA